MWRDSHDHSDGGSFSSEWEMSYSHIISLINFFNIIYSVSLDLLCYFIYEVFAAANHIIFIIF